MSLSKCCGDNADVKKGPWTPEEDRKLLAYIEEHGHGCWRSLPQKAGLHRCGKSCRLRWKNYLCPNIKRGKFTSQEEQTIIQLHALLGNRWSTIASHLPQRTDNEIKNYWNSYLKKRLTKMGLDPTTHKPRNHALLCGESKESANLCHMAQWESARLQAEARQGYNSRIKQNHYFDISKVGTSRTNTGQRLTGRTINGPQSSGLNLSDGLVPSPDVGSFNGNSSSILLSVSGPSNNYIGYAKGIMGKSVEVNKVVKPIYSSTAVAEQLGFPSIVEGFNFKATAPATDRILEGYWGSYEDNESMSYWNNAINMNDGFTDSIQSNLM